MMQYAARKYLLLINTSSNGIPAFRLEFLFRCFFASFFALATEQNPALVEIKKNCKTLHFTVLHHSLKRRRFQLSPLDAEFILNLIVSQTHVLASFIHTKTTENLRTFYQEQQPLGKQVFIAQTEIP